MAAVAPCGQDRHTRRAARPDERAKQQALRGEPAALTQGYQGALGHGAAGVGLADGFLAGDGGPQRLGQGMGACSPTAMPLECRQLVAGVRLTAALTRISGCGAARGTPATSTAASQAQWRWPERWIPKCPGIRFPQSMERSHRATQSDLAANPTASNVLGTCTKHTGCQRCLPQRH